MEWSRSRPPRAAVRPRAIEPIEVVDATLGGRSHPCSACARHFRIAEAIRLFCGAAAASSVSAESRCRSGPPHARRGRLCGQPAAAAACTGGGDENTSSSGGSSTSGGTSTSSGGSSSSLERQHERRGPGLRRPCVRCRDEQRQRAGHGAAHRRRLSGYWHWPLHRAACTS